MDWRKTLDGPKWIPAINGMEVLLDIPKDLLARMAFQESHFRPDVIGGIKVSSAGALGILQLMPQFFASVRRPVPFTEQDTIAQIKEAATYVKGLYNRFGDWAEALSAYNFGPGNEEKYLELKIRELPKETTDYVTEILADVPVPNGPKGLV